MTYRFIDVQPVTPTLGAMISGIDLNQPQPEEAYEEIKQALWKHEVVFLRNQKLAPERLAKLGSTIGELERHETFPTVDGLPTVQLLSHEGYESPDTDRWHADVTHRRRPNQVTMLNVTHAPPQGGDTMWASAGAAFDALGEPLKALALSLQAEHDMPFAFRRFDHYGDIERRERLAGKPVAISVLDREIKFLKENPPVLHPAVISHPVTSRKTLYVNSAWTKRFMGMNIELSEKLLAMFTEWLKKPEFCVRFKWEIDSLAIWDNAATQHYAVFDYAPHLRTGQRVICGSFQPAL